MVKKAHLVGSVNLADAVAVFTAVASKMGDWVTRRPDGETDRPFVQWMTPKFVGHPDVETLRLGGARRYCPAAGH